MEDNASGERWSVSALKCYVDRIVGDMRVHLEIRFSDREKAVETAYTDLQRRLTEINLAHDRVVEKERDFYSKANHEIYAASISKQLSDMQKQFLAAKVPNYAVIISLGILLVALVSGLWSLAMHPLQDQVAALKEELKKHESTVNDSQTANSLVLKHVQENQQLIQQLLPKHPGGKP